MLFLVIILAFVVIFCTVRMRSQKEELEKYRQSDRMKSVFIRALSREIRTSLHSVSGLAEIISKEDLYLSKSEKKSISDQIQYNTTLITTLLDEVGIFAGKGNTGHQLQDERFSPNRLCQRCIDGNRINLQDGVRMNLRNAVGEALFVSADRHLVELVLNKLVFNACKFTKKGEITVGYDFAPKERVLTFYVEDTGGGIPRDRRQKAFGWFDDPDLDADQTEFDLSVARKLAVKLNGYLREDETYQNGTRMEFSLPVR